MREGFELVPQPTPADMQVLVMSYGQVVRRGTLGDLMRPKEQDKESGGTVEDDKTDCRK